MAVFVALLRGINVGGHNSLPMQRLRELFETLDCHDVATYIQSGNVVLDCDADPKKLSASITTTVANEFGFKPAVFIIRAPEFLKIVSKNPYCDRIENPKFMHVWFLQHLANNVDQDRIQELAAPDEAYTLTRHAFYLHAPGGIARSKLAAGVEKCLGVNATARNWRTIEKLQAMIAERRQG